MSQQSKRSKHLVIDVTPLLPGGVNGGAKLITLNVLKDLQALFSTDSTWHMTLLTAPWNQVELQQYLSSPILSSHINYKNLKHLSRGSISLSHIFRKIYYKISQLPPFPSLLTELQADLLFCPFSNPCFKNIDIPCVSVLYDLQHWQYPEFFSVQERNHRNQYLKRMIAQSNIIICISRFSERSLYQYCDHHNLMPKATSVIYPYFKSSQSSQSSQTFLSDVATDTMIQNSKLLDPHLCKSTPYLLYPANYWAHKNHKLLLQAYASYLQWYRQSRPDVPCLHLVFTGTLVTEEQEIKTLAEHLKLTQQVHFLGYLDDRSFENVWEHCEGLIFPSLYEGFGLPIVEAMERSKPILCSQIPCLEEVTAGACLYFDPSQIQSLSNALRSFTLNLELRQDLKQQSQKRYEYFQNLNPIQDYLTVFENVLRLRNK